MKRIYNILKMLLWSLVVAFIGGSMYQYYDYKTNPDIYEWQSAPWYLSIEIGAAVTIAAVGVIITVMWIVTKKAGVK